MVDNDLASGCAFVAILGAIELRGQQPGGVPKLQKWKDQECDNPAGFGEVGGLSGAGIGSSGQVGRAGEETGDGVFLGFLGRPAEMRCTGR